MKEGTTSKPSTSQDQLKKPKLTKAQLAKLASVQKKSETKTKKKNKAKVSSSSSKSAPSKAAVEEWLASVDGPYQVGHHSHASQTQTCQDPKEAAQLSKHSSKSLQKSQSSFEKHCTFETVDSSRNVSQDQQSDMGPANKKNRATKAKTAPTRAKGKAATSSKTSSASTKVKKSKAKAPSLDLEVSRFLFS